MEHTKEIKEINGENYEVHKYKNEPYMLMREGTFTPVNTPKKVGQKVIIDWKAGDDDMNNNSMNYQYESFRPNGIPDIRIFIIVTLHHSTYFTGYTEFDPNKSITEIFFDGRGGWTETGHDGRLCHSHPILTFIN